MPPKKARGEGPPPLPNRDHLERANFALQASVFLQQLGSNATPVPSSSSGLATTTSTSTKFPSPVIADRKGKRRALEVDAGPSREADFARVARNEIRAFKKWTVHNQVKLDPSVKRTLCVCNTVLIPGLTARVRRRKDTIYRTCMVCGAGRSLPLFATGDMAEVVPKRRRRKEGKTPFHERERPAVTHDEAPAQKGKQKSKKGKEELSEGDNLAGHVLWRGSERLSGWGVLQEATDITKRAMGHSSAGEQQGPTSSLPTPECSAEELEACS